MENSVTSGRSEEMMKSLKEYFTEVKITLDEQSE